MGEDQTSGNRVSVFEAAERFSLTVEAIRKRISRGTITHKRVAELEAGQKPKKK